MATTVFMEWDGVSQDDYDSFMHSLALDNDPPTGLVLHAAGPKEGGWRVIELWEGQENFEGFMEVRLVPAAQKAGLSAQPSLEFFEAYNLYAPGLTLLADEGASSVPPSGQTAL